MQAPKVIGGDGVSIKSHACIVLSLINPASWASCAPLILENILFSVITISLCCRSYHDAEFGIMEPVSIAGSIVGLIVATLRISSLLTPIISETRDAPKNILEIKAEADNLRATLEQLQLLLLGRSQLLHSRTSLIRVDQVVLTLTACVSNISDLEVLLRPLKSDGSIGVLDRIGWVHNSEIVKEHLSKLQMHKSSLALILNILTWYAKRKHEEELS
jgi:hypothetical protein